MKQTKSLSKEQLKEARTKILAVLYPLHVHKTEAEAAAGGIIRFLARLKRAEKVAGKVVKKVVQKKGGRRAL